MIRVSEFESLLRHRRRLQGFPSFAGDFADLVVPSIDRYERLQIPRCDAVTVRPEQVVQVRRWPFSPITARPGREGGTPLFITPHSPAPRR